MPSSPILSRSRRDSWPPTQVRLDPVLPAIDSTDDDMDEDPLTYFLTPAPAIEDEDIDADLMDFDAGIEDASHPRDIVRSVSPSSLDGLDKTKKSHRRLSPEPPELSDSGASPYDDDSDEDYIRFQPPVGDRLGLPFSLRDFAVDGVKVPPRRSRTAPAATGDALLSPSPTARRPRPTANRGRSPAQAHIRGRAGPPPPRLRPTHVWREPSPDVWSIEEETTEDLGGDADVHMGDAASATDGSNTTTTSTTKTVDIPAAKPKKKVRFVLPVRE